MIHILYYEKLVRGTILFSIKSKQLEHQYKVHQY